MKIRSVGEDDVKELSRWFESVKWPMPPAENLLPKDSFLVELDGKPVACAFVYLTGTAFLYISWTNTNPDVSEKEQADGLEKIVKTVQEFAKVSSPKIRVIQTFTKNEKFATKLKNLDFRLDFGFYQATWLLKDDSKKIQKV